MALKKNLKVDLKRKYSRVFEISLTISLALLIVAFKFFPTIKGKKLKIQAPQEVVKVEDIINTKPETAPPPPPKPPIPIEAPSDEVLDNVEINETDLVENANITEPPPPPKEEEETVSKYFRTVEQMPAPIGGIGAIQKKIVYPEIAKRAGVQGKIFIKAFVDEHGNVVKAEVIEGIGAGCDEAAIKAVKGTKFKPGRQRGKPVKVQVSIPVFFKLN